MNNAREIAETIVTKAKELRSLSPSKNRGIPEAEYLLIMTDLVIENFSEMGFMPPPCSMNDIKMEVQKLVC
jgi:hypothetical protein